MNPVLNGTSSLKEKLELKLYYKLVFSTHNGLLIKSPKWQQKSPPVVFI